MQNQFTTHDWRFLKAIGSSGEMTPEEYLDANLHRDLSPCRWCGARTWQQHAPECRHGAPLHVCLISGDWPCEYSFARFMAARRRDYLDRMGKVMWTKTDLKFLRACGIGIEPSQNEILMAKRITAPVPPEVPEDGTMRWLRKAGIPVTAETWMQVQFMGTPPTPPFDGELFFELPKWVRRAYEPEADDDDEED